MIKRPVVIALMFSIWLVISAVTLVLHQSSTQHASITRMKNHTISQYESSQPIVIENISDFLAVGASGSGTFDDPYIIDSLEISSDGSCVAVINITAHFIIVNCRLESGVYEPAIFFENVENGRVVMCEIRDGGAGIAIVNSRFCSIENTSIYETEYGIYFNSVENSTINNSRIAMNQRGVDLDTSMFCQLINNSIYSNPLHGIDISFLSDNNTVLGNVIGWNGINALDYGEGNIFRGNAWSDFNGTIPYNIQGVSGSVDSSPQLLEDTNAPDIVPLPDIGIDVETSGNSMTWEVSDDYPLQYMIGIDERTERSAWYGENITLDLDSLAVGTHLITLTLYDGASNSVSDSVYVTIISFVLGGIGTELVMIASGITVAIFVIIILLVKKLS